MMIQSKKIILAVILLLCLVFAGCRMTYTVEGRVTFEDGTPLTVGTVVFESSSWSCRGELDSKGRYSMKGVQEGTTYNVYVLGAVETNQHNDKANGLTDDLKYLIDEKYRSPATSGITCDVGPKNPTAKKGRITFHFSVSKPNDE